MYPKKIKISILPFKIKLSVVGIQFGNT